MPHTHTPINVNKP